MRLERRCKAVVCLDNEIDVALKADVVLVTLLGAKSIYEHSESLLIDVPDNRVIYEELSNVPAFESDNAEKASRITYRVSVCSDHDLIEVINAVECVMISINFARHSVDRIVGLPLGIKGKVILFVINKEI